MNMFDETKMGSGISKSEEGGEAGIDLEKEGSGGADILKKALVEMSSQDDLNRLEGEAYQEKAERERYEGKKQEAEESYEHVNKRSYEQGATTYMAFEANDEFRRLRKENNWSHETKEAVIKATLEYLKGLGNEDEYRIRKYIDDAGFNSTETYLSFGSYTHKVEEGFNKEGYIEAMKQLSEMINRIWKQQEEGVKTNEILALREKSDRQARKRHLEGFGMTALEHNDLITAVDAFIEGRLLDDAEIAEKVVEKINELAQSSKPEDKIKATDAKESLKKFFEGEEEEEE